MALGEEKRHEILMAIRRPPKRCRLKQPQAAIIPMRPRVEMLDKEPAPEKEETEGIQPQVDSHMDGVVVDSAIFRELDRRVKRLEELTAKKKDVKPCRARNLSGTKEASTHCAVCGRPKSERAKWYLRDDRPYGAVCKECRINKAKESKKRKASAASE